LSFPFNQNGDIINTRNPSEILREWATSKATADIVLSFENARIHYRNSRSNQPAGWEITLIARNQGETPLEAGQINIVVIDSDDEVVFEIIGANAESFLFQRVIPGRWSAISTADGRVGG
jgi:hypothetical protein